MTGLKAKLLAESQLKDVQAAELEADNKRKSEEQAALITTLQQENKLKDDQLVAASLALNMQDKASKETPVMPPQESASTLIPQSSFVHLGQAMMSQEHANGSTNKDKRTRNEAKKALKAQHLAKVHSSSQEAATNGNLNLLRNLLLRASSNSHSTSSRSAAVAAILNARDEQGRGLLIRVVQASRTKVLKLLLAQTRTIQEKFTGTGTCTGAGIRTGTSSRNGGTGAGTVVCIADLDLQDNDGCTAMHFAAGQGNLIHVQLLVQAGARSNVPNNAGTYR